MKLHLTPESSAYSVSRKPEVLSVELDGGAARYRQDILNSAFMVDVTFILNPEEYEYLMAFFRGACYHGSEVFQIDLLLDTPDFVEYDAHWEKGRMPVLTSQQGLAYTVSARLEVLKPFNPTEADDDDAIITAYEAAHGF